MNKCFWSFLFTLLLAACSDGNDSQPNPTSNTAPTISAIKGRVTYSNTPTIIKVDATDPDGDTMTFNASPDDNKLEVSWDGPYLTLMPTENEIGIVDITVSVSDGNLQTSTIFEIEVLKTSIPLIQEIEVDKTLTPPPLPPPV